MPRIKTTLLLAALTGLILAAGYYLGGQSGALIALVLSAVMNFVSYWYSDKIVLSLYRAKQITSADDPELYRQLVQLSQAASLPTPRLYLIDMPVPNAFATGRNEHHAAVAVTTGIRNLLTPDELRGVLAHELAHIKNRDILISSVAATLAGALSYLAQFAYFGAALAGGSRDDRDGGGLGALVMLILAPITATLLHLAISRSREYLADETGARIARDSRGLSEALKKLHTYTAQRPLMGEPKYEATAHLFIVNPFKPSFITSLFSTHPPLEERVKRLEALRVV